MHPFRLTREQSRRVDQLAVEEYGFSGLVLMENAGREVDEARLPDVQGQPDPFAVVRVGI